MAEHGNGSKKSGGGLLGSLAQAEGMIQLALALPICCGIGWFAGDLLDKHFHTSWMMVTGVILGAVAGFVQIITTSMRMMKRGS